MNFYIINDVDRAERRHVMQEMNDGTLNYMHHDLFHMGPYSVRKESTTMSDFGFDVEIKNGHAIFTQVSVSIAQYDDGQGRKWQDVTVFSLPMLTDKTTL